MGKQTLNWFTVSYFTHTTLPIKLFILNWLELHKNANKFVAVFPMERFLSKQQRNHSK